MKKFKSTLSLLLVFLLAFSIVATPLSVSATELVADEVIDISNLTTTKDGVTSALESYSIDDFDTFYNLYTSDKLPAVYVTDFLFDGVGAVSKYDIDDTTNEVTSEVISSTIINVDTTGNIEFTGTAKKTAIAVNTNNKVGEINIILNNVNITSKNSTSAIFVYNKDPNYTDCKATIVPKANTENYVTGGRLKKVSTMDKDSLTGNYATLSDYYGIYSSDELKNILFASDTADQEGIADGDPKTYYKSNGAIGSDIDINFCGEGYLEITSTKKEGIESKADINFTGGVGNYKIVAYDDCLNASTSNTDIYIDVESLCFVCETDPDLEAGETAEGDGIDSNGTIHIEGGVISGYSSTNQADTPLDSDRGSYINGGTVITAGMSASSISTSSTQNVMNLTFSTQQTAGTVVCITDNNYNPILAFTPAKDFKAISVSSPLITTGSTYYVYAGGTVEGTEAFGVYHSVYGYQSGTQQSYSGTSTGNNNRPGGGGTRPTPGGNTTGNTAFTLSSAQMNFTGLTNASTTVEITIPVTEAPTTEPTTEPTTVPTEPTTEPTEATTVPTEPTTEPTEATTVPTEPTTEPTEATTVSTEPTTEPTEATTVPTDPTTPQTTKYTVAGDFLTPAWDPASNEMSRGFKFFDGGFYDYSLTVYVEAGTWNFKVTNGTWDVCYPANNYSFTVSQAGEVTIYFSSMSQEIAVDGEFIDNSEFVVEVITAVGNGDGTWLNGANWDVTDTTNDMIEVSPGVWEITYENIDAYDSYEVKFAVNHSWTYNWGIDGVFDSQTNIGQVVEQDGSSVTLRIDINNFDFKTKEGTVTTAFEVTPPETEPTTEPTTAPTEPTTVPTEPTTAPTEPTTAPTEPTTAPTEPTTAPTDPTTAPTEPTTAPTEPTTVPTEPTTAPTEPTTVPTEPTTEPTEPTGPRPIGDIDGDWEVSIKDATTAQSYVAKFISFTLEEMYYGDVNKDNQVNILDATLIQMICAKLPI